MHRAAEIDKLPIGLGRIHFLLERNDIGIAHRLVVGAIQHHHRCRHRSGRRRLHRLKANTNRRSGGSGAHTPCPRSPWKKTGWIPSVIKVLKKDGSLYICGDWVNSSALYRVLSKNCIIRNRITWEREKGRGSLSNWKNSSEDIWFCTKSNDYIFNVDAVKLKRKVIAPYKDEKGNPKDWDYEDGKGFRLTSPSNLWTDISVPFWSMPENTEHPTQKPEKLIAKLILASSNPGDIVLDGFLGSGTTAVVAKKLNRHFIGFEQSSRYACIALKRLEQANNASSIQGFDGQFFWERNTGIEQKKQKQQKSINESNTTLNKTSISLF